MREIEQDIDPSLQTTIDGPEAHAITVYDYHQGQATHTSTSGAVPPATDNEFNDNNTGDFINLNYPNENSTHEPAQITSTDAQSTGTQSQRRRIPSDGCSAATGFRLPNSTARDALFEPTVSAIPKVRAPPHAPRRISIAISGSVAITQTPLQQNQARNNQMGGGEVIGAILRGQMTAPSHSSETIPEAGIEGTESIRNVLLHKSHVGVSETMTFQNHLPEPSENSPQPSIRVLNQPHEPKSSVDNNEGEIKNRASTAKPLNTPRNPTFHGGNASYAGSVSSTVSTRPKKCILADEKLASALMERVDKLLEDNNPSSCNHQGVMHIKLMDEIIKPFYDKFANGADHPSDNSLLTRISSYRPPNTTIIVNGVDKEYFEAGWLLKPLPLEDSPIMDAHSSPSRPRPGVKYTQNHTPSAKRQQKSRSETSSSRKRSKQNSAQSLTSASSESRTSVSLSSAPKEFPCHLCTNRKENFQELRKWKRHYEIHFPPFFWACDICRFIVNRSDGMTQHCEGMKHKIRESPELSNRLDRSKFLIRDGGHEFCTYCTEDFHGWDSNKRKYHITNHILNNTPEVLLRSFNHRCTDPSCGEPDNYWKKSKYVLLKNRIRADPDNDTLESSQDDKSQGGDSTGTFEDADEQEGGDSNSQGQGGMGGSMEGGNGRGMGGGNRRGMGGGGRGSGRRRGSRGGPMPGNRLGSTPRQEFSGHVSQDGRLDPHRSLQSSLKPPEASKSPISAYMDDTTTYSVNGRWTPSRPSVPVVRGYMESHLQKISDPLE